MSYQRDKDAYTRGSGAIAASDYKNPRRARERQARLQRSAQIDRQRAQYTYGPRGGMGLIDQNTVGAGKVGRGYIDRSGGLDVPAQSTNPLGKPPQGGSGGGFTTTTTAAQYGRTTPITGYVDPNTAAVSPVITSTDMLLCWDGSYVPRTSIGLAMCPPQATAGQAVTAPNSPTSPLVAAAGGMSSSKKKWLLIAALGLGGYYLYQRNRRGGQ